MMRPVRQPTPDEVAVSPPPAPPALLFLDPDGRGRGLIAAALARHVLRGDDGRALEAGWVALHPSSPEPWALRVLQEIGAHPRDPDRADLDGQGVAHPTRIILLGPASPDPALPPDLPQERWALPEAPALPPEASEDEHLLAWRAVRDAIHARILGLSRLLGLRAPAAHRPTIAVVGWKNAGKTTLVERLVAELVHRGLRVGTVKATHHDVEPDEEGKDSWRHRRAGAVESLLVGPRRWVLVHEGSQSAVEARLRLGPVDLVVVEGLRGEDLPKIEVLSPGSDRPILGGQDPRVRLIAAEVDPGRGIPWRHRDDIAGIADVVLDLHRRGELDS